MFDVWNYCMSMVHWKQHVPTTLGTVLTQSYKQCCFTYLLCFRPLSSYLYASEHASYVFPNICIYVFRTFHHKNNTYPHICPSARRSETPVPHFGMAETQALLGRTVCPCFWGFVNFRKTQRIQWLEAQ